MVGRHGSYQHGIEIITEADYFTLSARSNAYLKVAPFIASYEEYRRPLARHLLLQKLRHWDRPIRCLSAAALGALVPTDPGYFLEMVDELIPLCLDKTLEVRTPRALASLAENWAHRNCRAHMGGSHASTGRGE